MKKVLLSALVGLGVFAGTTAQAQSSGTAVLSVTVADVVALTVNVAAVSFNLAAASSYNTDQTSTIPAQLTVLSTKPFDLDVRANTAALAFGANTIPLSVVKIESTNSDLGVTPAPAITLSASNQKLLDEATSNLAALINMKYTLATHSAFSSFSVPTGAYTTTLVYTASID